MGALTGVTEAIAAQRELFEEELAADREAGEHVAAELRACGQEEAPLQAQLHRVGEELTEAEVALQRARDRATDVERELTELAIRLELEVAPAEQELSAGERDALHTRLERLARRREQLGPVNPLAGQEYADAMAHVEELERQRTDLETALRELEKLISDTDRQIRETFEETFTAAAENFSGVVGAQLFPGARQAAAGVRAGVALPESSVARAPTGRTAIAVTKTMARRRRPPRRICWAWRSRSTRPARR